MRKKSEPSPSVRLNLSINGELAQWLLEWKERGLFKTNRELVAWALRVLHEQIVQRDLEEARLKTIRGNLEESG